MSTDWLSRLSSVAQHAVGTLCVRSALNPFLWACPVVGGVCFAAAYAFRADHAIALLLVIAGISPSACSWPSSTPTSSIGGVAAAAPVVKADRGEGRSRSH